MTQQEVIKTFNQSLDKTKLSGRTALDEAIQASSNFANYEEVRRKFLDDIENAKNWHTFLVEKCGIILDNADTGAISGSDAGGTEKTKNTVIPSKGAAKYPDGTSFKIKGLTIYGIPPKDLLTADQQYVVQGLYSWWIRDSLALIEESYGYSYTAADTTASRLKLKFVDDADENYLAYVSYDTTNGESYEGRVLCVNMAYFKDIDSSDRHATDEDGMALDRTLVHELVHGLMASNVNYFYDLPTFLSEGGTAELIHGVDDERYNNIIAYAKNPEVFEKILSPTYTESAREVYAGGYIFMRYFAKQAADTTFDYDTYRATVSTDSIGGFITNYYDKVTMRGGAGKDTITNSGEKVFITAGSNRDLIKNYSSKVTINAGGGADEITNDSASVSINGGTGSDEIINTGSNATIAGGDGADIIVNDISDYEPLNGVINLSLAKKGVNAGYGEVVIVAENDIKLSAYSGELLGGTSSAVYGGAGIDLITNYAGNVNIFGDADEDIITNYGTKSKIYGGDSDDVINNGASAAVINAMGEEATVTVFGSLTTIYGGNGADSITNESKSVKIYGQNNADSIANSGEEVSIYGGASKDYVSNTGKNVYISMSDGNDAVVNFGEKVSIYGSAGHDEILNESEKNAVYGGADNDEIMNFGDETSLYGGRGADSIYSSGSEVSISGGEGNDSIYSEGFNICIYGNAGKDSIYNFGDHVTISSGAGNDYIKNDGGKHIMYNFGKDFGKDTVVGFNANDTIKIVSGSYSTKKSGNNVIVSVSNNTLTLRNATGKKINFISASGKTSTKTFSASTSKNLTNSKLWFAEENNFATADNLDALVKNKSSAISLGKIDNVDYKNLAKKPTVITYSKK